MIAYANAKINLGLQVLQKRLDGYHDLQSIFFPVGLYDILEIVHSCDGNFRFTTSGIPIEGVSEKNTCVLAFRVFQKRFDVENVHLHLHKAIPTGSGLGGGSSDGAFVLKLLNSLFQKGLGEEVLEELALEVGSDCPFFIRNIPMWVTGRGDIMKPVSLSLNDYWLVMVRPGFAVSTSEAYSRITPRTGRCSPLKVIGHPVSAWRGILHNDFEDVVFPMYPEGKTMKEDLYLAGALYAQMTGSGSVIFGIFSQRPDLPVEMRKRVCFSGLVSDIQIKK